ncbi:MAG: helix-turn-helix domain-containing protein [Caulobacter sp.]|nr:helix-turn-helix domain-containing protein [Caulobacter sp.]
MALDTGGVTFLYRTGEYDPSEGTRSEAPGLHDGSDIGAALKAVRQFQGVSLQDIADATRIRQNYLAALEDMRIDELPSRPFAIGYVKAYARHLGLDQDEAVERFKLDSPEHDDGLRAPVGVRKQHDPRLGLVLIAAVLVIAAFALWNVAQRTLSAQAPAPAVVADQEALPATPQQDGPITVGAAAPPPVESTTPEPYVTPGLANNADGSSVGPATPAPSMPVGSPFKSKGQIYGAPAGRAAPIIVQARKAAAFEVRGADGSPYFVRVLQAGEAYRVPMLAGLSLTVSDPGDFDVFGPEGYIGPLPGPVTKGAALLPKAPPAPKPAPKPAAKAQTPLPAPVAPTATDAPPVQ